MFIPRSLARKVPASSGLKTTLPTEPSGSTTPGNTKKRTTRSDDNSNGSSGAGFGSKSDNGDSSQSESGSTSDSDEEPKVPETIAENTSNRPTNKSSSQKQIDQSEIAARLELALSDLSIWKNDFLYQRLLATSEWYIPFSRLHDHPVLAPLFNKSSARIPDAALVNSLRKYGFGLFESRMIMRAPSNAAWKGKSREPAGWVGTAGGYEVRCKTWAGREEGWIDKLAATEEQTWQARTVYIERAPPTIHSIWALYHFVTALGRLECLNEGDAYQIVQDVFIPTADANHPPETTRRFRGQAFVVFANEQLAQAFCSRWSWNASREPTASAPSLKSSEIWDTNTAAEVAGSCGFRSITKTQWDKLKSEYLEYQARVLQQSPRQQRTRANDSVAANQSVSLPATSTTHAKPIPQYRPPNKVHHPPPFPPGILVFIRRLHPETNKTTLKTLCGRAFKNGDAIEYLDFQKGIDSAHVRLCSPEDATTLAKYFSQNSLTQRDGLDDQGQPTDNNPIDAEVVLGTRETNYWAKVPEKVRMAAVAKAGLAGNGTGETPTEDNGAKSRRKRQRKT